MASEWTLEQRSIGSAPRMLWPARRGTYRKYDEPRATARNRHRETVREEKQRAKLEAGHE